MSLLNRRTLLVSLAPLALAACGFTPVHAPGGTGDALYGQVLVQAPEDIPSTSEVDSYLLVQNLEHRLGRSDAGAYQLDLTLRTRDDGQAITDDSEITRYSLLGKATYTLTRNSDGKVVASGEEEAFTGYSATGTTVETLASERDAHQRLMVILADQINTRILTTVDLSIDPTPVQAPPA
jgi:LPS-assembly lipoprotein